MNEKYLFKMSEQLPNAFLYSKGYDAFRNIASHGGSNIYDAYLSHQKTYASSITQQQAQLTFISKFTQPGKDS